MKLFRNPWFWSMLIGLIALSLVWAAYRFNWSGTGFQGKTVWDWLSLLIIPLALALVALFFNQTNTSTERKIALDKQREDLFQAYLDRMSELLLEKGLRTSPADAEVRNVARTRTISVLRQLDVRRVANVFTFLREAGLMNAPNPIISLRRANLTNINWSGVNLTGANLSGAILRYANLSGAVLEGANLTGARLDFANLSHAYLNDADLTDVEVTNANLTGTIFSRTRISGIFDSSSLTQEQKAGIIGFW